MTRALFCLGLFWASSVVAAEPAPSPDEQPDAPPAGEQAAAPAPTTNAPGPKPRLLIMDLNAGEEINKTVRDTVGGLITAEVSRRETFESISGEDIRNMVALEGQKQAMGCDDSSACLAEIAGALGARLVVFGRLNQVAGQFILQMSLLDAQSAQVIGRDVFKAADEGALLRGLPGVVADVLRPAYAALGVPEEVVHVEEEPLAEDGGGGLSSALLGTGAAVGIAGVAVGVLAAGTAAAVYWGALANTDLPSGLRKNAQLGWYGLVALSALGAVVVVPGLAVAGASFVVE